MMNDQVKQLTHGLGDASLSRSNLDYILKGQVDVQATTLKKIADGLEVPAHQLLKF